jgi:hypothetical protein
LERGGVVEDELLEPVGDERDEEERIEQRG